jgi:DNA replication licensing factor MCM3
MLAQSAKYVDTDEKWQNFTYGMQTLLDKPEYTEAIEDMLRSNRSRLPINLDNLRKSNADFIPYIFNNPTKSLSECQKILNGKVQDLTGGSLGGSKKKQNGNVMFKNPSYHVTFEGNMGRFLVTPRGLHSTLINKLVAVQGIVTRISIVRPKLMHSVHYCDETKVGTVREYYDQYTLDAKDRENVAMSNAYPTKDQEGRPLTTEYGFCQYKDVQTLVIQEMPEKAPTGLLPRSVEVILEDDLVDRAKPGDRVQIVGVYKCVNTSSAVNNAVFKTIFVATGVNILSNDAGEIVPTPEDLKNIRTISQRSDLFELVGRSFAPSIQGHETVKKSMILMLLGGLERNLENGTHLRGDINLLMIGDPSTAKSQLLRHVMNLSPLAIHTTGRGSSGVGLTAAVTYDRDTGERHLEAGAMVLADRGIVCVDEFDKMNEADRVAIHEVMEQQTVTIAKAGIHTSLNARCSVVAAANPIYGEYQRDLPPTRNIGLPDSLLSRFDLIFVVLDEKDPEIDRLIAERVTRNHRFINPNGTPEGDFLSRLNHDEDEAYVIEPEIGDPSESTAVFEKLLATGSDAQNLLCQKFLKKYVMYAKKTVKPTLNDEAIEYITKVWSELRQREAEANSISAFKVMPLTTRTFETIIRLATAHAKLRLSQVIEKQDCEVSVKLLNVALFGDSTDDGRDNGGNDDDFHPGGGMGRGNRQGRPEKKEEEMKKDAPRATRTSGKPAPQTKKSTESPTSKLEKGMEKLAIQTPPDKSAKKKVKEAAEDDEDNMGAVLDRQVIGSIKITPENTKFVFKNLVELHKSSKKSVVSYDDLWIYLQTKSVAGGAEGSDIDSREKMIKVLIDLENNNKIMINQTAEFIYLL